MSSLTDPTSLDAAFDALSDPYRRRILVAVSDHDPREEFAPAEFVPDDDREGPRTRLHHSHLPKLAEHGYIEWDRDAGAIWRGSNFDEIAPLLDVLVEHQGRISADRP